MYINIFHVLVASCMSHNDNLYHDYHRFPKHFSLTKRCRFSNYTQCTSEQGKLQPIFPKATTSPTQSIAHPITTHTISTEISYYSPSQASHQYKETWTLYSSTLPHPLLVLQCSHRPQISPGTAVSTSS